MACLLSGVCMKGFGLFDCYLYLLSCDVPSLIKTMAAMDMVPSSIYIYVYV